MIADFDEAASDVYSPEGRAAVDQLATFLIDAAPHGRSLKTVQLLSAGEDEKTAWPWRSARPWRSTTASAPW